MNNESSSRGYYGYRDLIDGIRSQGIGEINEECTPQYIDPAELKRLMLHWSEYQKRSKAAKPEILKIFTLRCYRNDQYLFFVHCKVPRENNTKWVYLFRDENKISRVDESRIDFVRRGTEIEMTHVWKIYRDNKAVVMDINDLTKEYRTHALGKINNWFI